MKTDKDYMQMCFTLAKQALGNTSPNPYVGAVIVHNNQVIATGYHRKAGEDHAELDALKKLDSIPANSTLYCNLEPCCHENKRTPPCAQRIIKEGFSKVVIANLDPNPSVAGKGVQLLRDAGIEVITGVLEEEGALLNEVFFTQITKKRPYIHLKWAQTIDGNIATTTGDSKWITSEIAREHVHRERSLYDGIMVGAETARKDNPKLTVRLGDEVRCKKRVLLSSKGEFPSGLNVFNDEYKDNTIVISASEQDHSNSIKCPTQANKIDLNCALESLYSEGIKSLYVEGGAGLIQSFLEADIADRISIYIAPKILGGGKKVELSTKKTKMDEANFFSKGVWKGLGPDMLFESQRNICLQDL